MTRCLPVLKCLGSGVTRIGPCPELAHALKLGAHVFTLAMVEIMAEVLAFGEKAGYPPSEYLRVLNLGLFKSPLLDAFGGFMVRHDHAPMDLTLDQAEKGMVALLEAAEAVQASLPLAGPLLEEVREAQARKMGALDLTALSRLHRQEGGLAPGPVSRRRTKSEGVPAPGTASHPAEPDHTLAVAPSPPAVLPAAAAAPALPPPPTAQSAEAPENLAAPEPPPPAPPSAAQPVEKSGGPSRRPIRLSGPGRGPGNGPGPVAHDPFPGPERHCLGLGGRPPLCHSVGRAGGRGARHAPGPVRAHPGGHPAPAPGGGGVPAPAGRPGPGLGGRGGEADGLPGRSQAAQVLPGPLKRAALSGEGFVQGPGDGAPACGKLPGTQRGPGRLGCLGGFMKQLENPFSGQLHRWR